MKRMILAVVVGSGAALFAASPARADEPKPVPTSSAPVVVSSTPDVVTTAPASRRGLIARLRDRRTGGTMTTSPLTTTGTIVTPSTTTSPGTTIPTPIPMPMGKPSIVLPAGGTTGDTPLSAVVPASGTVTMASPTMVAMPATTTPTRTGLVARLRARGK